MCVLYFGLGSRKHSINLVVYAIAQPANMGTNGPRRWVWFVAGAPIEPNVPFLFPGRRK